ncbi:MAG: Hsp70 family protein [Planctomycetota bacterium]
MNDPPPPVGIDLGTAYSAIACIDAAGIPQVVANEMAELAMPSTLLFDAQVFAGREAKERREFALDNYADGFKRDIGKPYFSRPLRGQSVPPEVLSGFLVQKLVRDAKPIVGEFESAVVTVPAYFDSRQRMATRRAIALGGLTTIDIVNEPTAAAIATGYERQRLGLASERYKILVYDLGGGTFDATLLVVEDNVFKTFRTDGEAFLGGRDFDACLSEILASKFVEKHGINPHSDPFYAIALNRLAERAKHALSDQTQVQVQFEYAGIAHEMTVSRGEFENAIGPRVERSIMTCQATLADAGLTFADLDEVLMVGGSSRIPLVRQRLQQEAGRPITLHAEPDQVVAKGAAVYCAMASRHPSIPQDSQFEIVNVNSHGLGILGVSLETGEQANQVMIPRNTQLPAQASMAFTTAKDNQSNIRVRLVEGESENPKYCTHLGRGTVKLPSGLPRGTVVHVQCQYDRVGSISVRARIPSTGVDAVVAWNGEGHESLEPLGRWRERLCSRFDGETPNGDVRQSQQNQTGKAGTPWPSALPRDTSLQADSERGRILERLDQLYRYVADHCEANGESGGGTSSEFGLAQVRRIGERLQILESAQKAILAARQSAPPLQDDVESKSHLSTIQIEHHRLTKLHDHLKVEAGRQRFDSPRPLDIDDELGNEIRRLTNWLLEPDSRISPGSQISSGSRISPGY